MEWETLGEDEAQAISATIRRAVRATVIAARGARP
jgi:hypothetical protein